MIGMADFEARAQGGRARRRVPGSSMARNVAMFANESGGYDDLAGLPQGEQDLLDEPRSGPVNDLREELARARRCSTSGGSTRHPRCWPGWSRQSRRAARPPGA